jgi:hypothetical protein
MCLVRLLARQLHVVVMVRSDGFVMALRGRGLIVMVRINFLLSVCRERVDRESAEREYQDSDS